MSNYFDGLNKDTVQEKIREMTKEIPELSDVDLYQRKQDLIEEATVIINANLQPGAGDPLQDGFEDDAEAAAQEAEAAQEETVQDEPETHRPGQQSSAAWQPRPLHPEV